MFKENCYLYEGLAIIPLRVKSKKPVFDDWSDFCKRLPTEEEIDLWIERYPRGNIGLCLGPSSGIIAVDIDLDSAMDLVPPSPMVKKGQDGETRFFRYNGELPFKRHDIGIELLSVGNQTVMPPSIHDETLKPYFWVRKDCSFDELPYLDPNFSSRINGSAKKKSNITRSDGKRCNHGSHTKLSEMLIAAVNNNDSPDIIANSLISYDEKINTEVSYFLCPSRSEWRTDNKIVNAYQFVLDAMKRHSDLVKPQVSFEIIEKKKETPHEIDYKKESLPHFRGIAQNIFKHIYETSPIPRTRFAVASTLATMGTILGNRVQCDGFHPNIYSLITAQSGGGKDRALRFPYELFTKSNCKDLIGSAPESDSGILMNLEKQTTRLDVFDEASRLFYMMGDTKNLYAGKMADVYAMLYTSSGKHFSGKTLKDRKIGGCFSPNVNLLCALTISDFQKSFNSDLLSKGVGGRFLFFPDNQYKDIVTVEQKDIPEEIIDYCHDMRNTIERKNINLSEHKMVNLTISSAVKNDRLKLVNTYRKAGHDQNLESIYNRSVETLMKLAIIDTCSQKSTELKMENFEWAVEWFEKYLAAISLFLDHNLFSSRQQMIEVGILDFIKSKGADGCPSSELFSSKIIRNNNLQKREINLYLDTAFEREQIFSQKISTSGRPRFTFYHSDFIKK
jgi:hypothetical protein